MRQREIERLQRLLALVPDPVIVPRKEVRPQPPESILRREERRLGFDPLAKYNPRPPGGKRKPGRKLGIQDPLKLLGLRK